MYKILKNLVNRMPLVGHLVGAIRHKKLIRQWEQARKEGGGGHFIKQQAVKEYAKKYDMHVFVETGTCLGEMVYAVKNLFNEVYSIELDNEFYKGANQLFRKHRHINILHGDSALVLPDVLNMLEDPTLFWLDGHYSGGITAMGDKETPILEELESIMEHRQYKHVILIDDARCFNGKKDYPTLEGLRELVINKWPDAKFEVKDDIIRLTRD